jgi:hypothetical protein
MKNTLSAFLLLLFIGIARLEAQDLVGLSHKQVLEYWQKKVPADQISDNNDLLVINGSTFCSFEKKICVDYTTTISAGEFEKYKAQLNADKDLHYDDKTQTWINAVKKFGWKLTKVGETDYELSCKKL